MHKFRATSNSKSVVLTNGLLLCIKINTSNSSSNTCRIDHFDSTFILPSNDKMWMIASHRRWEKVLKPSLWWTNPRIFFSICANSWVLNSNCTFELLLSKKTLENLKYFNSGHQNFLTVKFRSNYCTSH